MQQKDTLKNISDIYGKKKRKTNSECKNLDVNTFAM